MQFTMHIIDNLTGWSHNWFVSGNSDSFQEVKGVRKDSVVYYDAPNTNLSFHVHCYADIRDYRQYENFQIMTKNGRYPVLDVIDDVTTWRPGNGKCLSLFTLVSVEWDCRLLALFI